MDILDKKILNMKLPGRRKRERPQRTFMDVKKAMTEKDARK